VTRDSDQQEVGLAVAPVGKDGLSFAPLAGLPTGNYHINLSVISGSFTVETPNLPLASALTVHPRPPEASQDAFECDMDGSANLRVLKLLTNDIDLEGATLSLAGVDTASIRGGTVTLSQDGQFILYTPPANFQGLDRFQYQVDNGQAPPSRGTVAVIVRPTGLGPSPNIVSISAGNAGILITFLGVPGRTYKIEGTDSLAPATWIPLGTALAGPNGLYQFLDTTVDPNSSRYYRAVLP
jgi:hypothetical protein